MPTMLKDLEQFRDALNEVMDNVALFDCNVEVYHDLEHVHKMRGSGGICLVGIRCNIGYDYLKPLYRKYLGVHKSGYGAPSTDYPVDGRAEFHSSANLWRNPKRIALAKYIVECVERDIKNAKAYTAHLHVDVSNMYV